MLNSLIGIWVVISFYLSYLIGLRIDFVGKTDPIWIKGFSALYMNFVLHLGLLAIVVGLYQAFTTVPMETVQVIGGVVCGISAYFAIINAKKILKRRKELAQKVTPKQVTQPVAEPVRRSVYELFD